MSERWAIIPVKQLSKGKSRLAEVLTSIDRQTIIMNMLVHTIKVAQNAKGIDQVLIISKDLSILDIGHNYHTYTVLETCKPNLNHAIQQATQYAISNKADGLVILPADLPFLSAVDLDKIISLADESPGIIIVPDRRNNGTNLMVISPPGIISYKYGRNSFKRHIEQSSKNKIPLKIVINHLISIDLDLPEDMKEICKIMNVSKDSSHFPNICGAGYEL